MKNIYLCSLLLFFIYSLNAQNLRWDNQFIAANAPNDTVFAIAESGNNTIVGGAFTTAGGISANHIALFNGSTWSAFGTGTNGNVYDIVSFNTFIIAGGSFTTAGGTAAQNLALWNGTTWVAFAGICNGTVRTLEVFDQYLYVGGDFTTIGGISANHIARFNGTVWEALGTGTDGPVYDIHQSTFLYVGGNFLNAGGNSTNYFARWNGIDWQPFGNGFDAPVYSIKGSGVQVTVGGAFVQSGTTVLNHVAKWDGVQWLALDGGTNGTIREIEEIGGDFYFCGNFSSAGTTTVSNIAQWNGSSWKTLGNGINQEGFSLGHSGFDLFCGGDFTTAGLNPSLHFGRYFSPPVIVSQSGVVTKCEGDSLIMAVNAQSSLNMSYQWKKEGVSIGPNNDSLIIFPAAAINSGNYSCIVTNSVGTDTSSNITVTVYEKPVFATTLTNISSCAGNTLNMAVSATGSAPLNLQWYLNSGILAGETNDTLHFASLITGATGNYMCIVQNFCSSDTSYFNLVVNTNPVVNFTGLATEYCINDSAVVLSGTPVGGTFTGNGITGSAFSPAGLVGNHTINYTYTDGNGCSAISSQSTLVHTLTFVTFSGLSANYCFNANNDTLHGVPAGGIYYGAGMNDSIFSPSQITPGNHTVFYAYTDGNGCTNTKSLSTFVFSPQVFNYPGLDTSFCYGDNLFSIVVNPTGGTFSGTGISGNVFNPDAAGLGSHLIIYQYADANSCVNTDSLNFHVSSLPSTVLTGVSAEYCVNSIIDTIVGNPAGGIFSGINITSQYLNPALFSPGGYSVFYTYTDSVGCSNTDTALFSVVNASTVFFSGISTYYCENESADTLTGFPTGGVFSGNGVTGNVFSPALAGSGTHAVVYTYDNMNGCLSYDSVDVTVAALPVISLGADSSICMGQSVVLTAAGDTGTYLWNTGQGTQSITVIPNVTTNYIAFLFSGNCHNSDTVTVTVNPLPVLDLGPDTSACSPAQIIAPGGFSSYLWSNGEADTVVAVTLSGSYSLSVTNSFGCLDSDYIEVTLLPTPVVDLGSDKIISGLQTVIIGAATNFTTYNWSNGSHQSYIVIDGSTLGEGTFPFWLTVFNIAGCSSSDTINITVSGDVGVNQNEVITNLSIYPNPVSDYLFINRSGITISELSIVSVTGKVIVTYYQSTLENLNYRISVKDLPSGIYSIKGIANNVQFNKKMVVN
jgi:hypothetical protein